MHSVSISLIFMWFSLQSNFHFYIVFLYLYFVVFPFLEVEQATVDQAINDICILLQCSRHNLNVVCTPKASHILLYLESTCLQYEHVISM